MATDSGQALPGTRQRRPASLRLRLGIGSVLTLVVSLGLVGLALDAAYQRSAESDLQQQMETWVYLVLGAMEPDQAGQVMVSGELGDPLLNQPGSGVLALVSDASESWASPSALGIELPQMAPQEAGTTQFQPPREDLAWYTFQYGLAWELPNGGILPFTVNILVDPDRMQPQIKAFRAGLWRSLGAAGLILALAQLALFALGLRPLKRIADDVADIESGRIESLTDTYPRELEPLTGSLNRVLNTEKANQARYRNALDSLAHSLKTPLAVLRSGLHADPLRDREGLNHAVDDMHHLIATRLERAAASTRRTMGAPVPVAPVVERLTRSLGKIYSQHLRNIDANIDPGLMFYGEERDLLEMMGNLLDNACKYGGGQVRLAASVLGDGPRPGLVLEVANDGDPVPLERLDELTQRGVRGDQRLEGHGLGLSIVSEVVSAYGGDMQFSVSDLGGLGVRVEMPPV